MKKASLKQIEHLIILHVSVGEMYSYSKLSNLSVQEASDLIMKLRGESNDHLTKIYQKFYKIDPHPSELWAIK